MRSKIAVFFSLGFLLLLCGCLEFEEQSMSYRYDEKTDTLYIFQDYRGIAASSGEKLSADEVQQLESVIKTERTFFFANWIFEFNREESVFGVYSYFLVAKKSRHDVTAFLKRREPVIAYWLPVVF